MKYKKIKKIQHENINCEVGCNFIVKRKPNFWNSYLNGNSPLYLKDSDFPYEGTIIDMCTDYYSIAITDGRYGWSLSDLIETNNITMIPNLTQMRKQKMKKIENVELTKEYVKILTFLGCQIIDNSIVCSKKLLNKLEIDPLKISTEENGSPYQIVIDMKNITEIFFFKTSWSHIMPVIVKIMSTKAEPLILADVSLSLNRLDKQEIYTSIIKFINDTQTKQEFEVL